MSEPDKYYEQARALVTHCRYCDRDYKCPEDLEQDRQDVAARLRADGLEIERLKTANGQLTADLMGCRDGALVRDLRVEIERLNSLILDRADEWSGAISEVAQLKAQLAGLHGQILQLPESNLDRYESLAVKSAYMIGHRDACHAAAELCLTLAQM